MSDSSKEMLSKITNGKPKKVWPTRWNTKRYYIVILLLYGVVAFFVFFQPIKELGNVNEKILTVPLDLLVSYVFLFLTIRYFWRAERARKGTWYEIGKDKIVRTDGILSRDFKDGVMSEELKEDPVLNVMTKARHWRYHTREIPYSMVERVDMHQNLMERVMNIGNIKIDTGEEEIWMMRVPQARETKDLINTLVSENTMRPYRGRDRESAPESAPKSRKPAQGPPERRKP